MPTANLRIVSGNLYIGSGPSNPYRISIEESVAGLTGQSIQNTSSNAAAGVNLQHIVEAGAADAFSLYAVNGGSTWSVGLDNSDTDSFKITTGSSPSAGTIAIKADSSGNITTANSITATSGAITATAGNIVASAGNVYAIGSGSTQAKIYARTQSNDTVGTAFYVQKSRSGGVITSGDDIGSYAYQGYDGSTFSTGAYIKAVSTGTIGASRIPMDLQFFTKPDSATAITKRMTIASTGAVTIAAPDSGTGLTISGGGSSTTGRADFANGISFDAGTNTLSAYTARSTFTPVLAFGGGSTGITYSTQTGLYNLVGKMLHFHISLVLTNKGSSTGSATITGLPTATYTSCNPVYTFRYANVTFTGIPDMRSTSPSTTIILEEYTSGGAAAAFTDANFSNSSVIIINGFYFIA